MKICAVVVTYNRKDLLRQCLQSLLRQTRALDDIIIIDNASTDGTEEMVKKEFSRLSYHKLPENLGGSGGFHQGVKLAEEQGYDWFWLMDDDVETAPDALAELTKVIEDVKDQKVGAILSRVLSSDDNLAPPAKWRYQGDYEAILFVGFLLSSQVAKEVGPPRGDFFIYCDDVEYVWRLRRAGYKIIKSLTSKVFHKDWLQIFEEKRLFFWTFKLPTYPAWKDYYLTRNNLLLARSIGQYQKKMLLVPLYITFKLIVKNLLFLRFDRLGYIAKGAWHALRGKTGKLL